MMYDSISDYKITQLYDFLFKWSCLEESFTPFVNGYIEMNVYNFHVDEDMQMTVQWAQRLLTATIELKRIIHSRFVNDIHLLSELIDILNSGIEDKALLN